MEILPSTLQETEYVRNRLYEFNNEQLPFTQDQAIIQQNYVIKDNGTIIAGINARIYGWKILCVDILFIDKNYRGKDLGSKLLQKVESEAKTLGSTLVHLDTFDFQAKDFYLKQGYEVFGVLEDCPPGHKRYYLKKRL